MRLRRCGVFRIRPYQERSEKSQLVEEKEPTTVQKDTEDEHPDHFIGFCCFKSHVKYVHTGCALFLLLLIGFMVLSIPFMRATDEGTPWHQAFLFIGAVGFSAFIGSTFYAIRIQKSLFVREYAQVLLGAALAMLIGWIVGIVMIVDPRGPEGIYFHNHLKLPDDVEDIYVTQAGGILLIAASLVYQTIFYICSRVGFRLHSYLKTVEVEQERLLSTQMV